jgi:hypothetical protein
MRTRAFRDSDPCTWRDSTNRGDSDSIESMPHRPSAVRDDRHGSRTEASDSEAEASEATGTLRQALA